MGFHIVKRDSCPMWKKLSLYLGAVLLALVVGGLLLAIGVNPIAYYQRMFTMGMIGNKIAYKTFENYLKVFVPLVLTSVALSLSFKMRFWNIGGEGQVLMGGLATAACMILLGNKLPNYLLIPIMVFASVAAGAVWGMIPAIFKAKWDTNETLFTLMMNYVATQLVAFFVIVWEVPKGAGKIGIINQATEAGWLPQIGGQKYLLNILVVALLTVGMYIYLNYTKHGYEISVVGESQDTARYVGIKVERVIVRTMVVSGAICGLAGLLLVAGTNHTVTTTIAGGRGWLAIALVIFTIWRPSVSIPASMLFGGLYILHLYIPTGMNLAVKELYKMLPYIVTIVVLIITSMRNKRESQPPASLGLPYFREER